MFITCASFEERCLGIPRRFAKEYQFRNGFIFVYDDPNDERLDHLKQMKAILKSRGVLQEIPTSEKEPLPAIGKLTTMLGKLKLRPTSEHVVTVDVTTFTKRHLLMLFKAIDDLGLWNVLRIYYTEPRNYVTNLYLPMSMGIRTVSQITGFMSFTPLDKPTLLVILLGYEGDRAKAIYENLDPNKVLLVIPKPPYHPEWDGRTEEMNKHLIKIVGKDKIKYVHSTDSAVAADQLAEILGEYPLDRWRCSIAPLGTKPQTLGVYLFWRRNRGRFSVIYAQPLRHNERFFSEGIGNTLLLLSP